MVNILLLCKRHYTGHDLLNDKFGRLYHFPKQWATCGHQVTVIAADYRGLSLETLIEPNLRFIAAPLLPLRTGFTKQIQATIAQQRPDIVIASCDSHLGFMGLRLARRLGVPFVFDLYHNYEDFLGNRIPGMRRMYDSALDGADLVVCDSEALAALVEQRCRTIHIAQQGTDGSIFLPLNRDHSRQALDLPFEKDHQLLAYVGSIDSRFDGDTILAALGAISDDGRQLSLLIAGQGIDRRMRNHHRIHYLGRLPQAKIPLVIASADLCLIPYKRTRLAETCNPCKLSEYIACSRAIVASDVSNISRYLPKSGHLCYEPGNVSSLLNSITRQLTAPVIEDRGTALLWKNVGEEYLSALERMYVKRHDA